jgi:putative transposase
MVKAELTGRAQRQVFYTLQGAEFVIEGWRQHDDTIRRHSSFGYVPPAPEVVLAGCATLTSSAGHPSRGATPIVH